MFQIQLQFIASSMNNKLALVQSRTDDKLLCVIINHEICDIYTRPRVVMNMFATCKLVNTNNFGSLPAQCVGQGLKTLNMLNTLFWFVLHGFTWEMR